MGTDLRSVQIIDTYLDHYVPFISFSFFDMNYLSMDFINKRIEFLVGRNAFSVGIDATKVVKDVRLSQRYNSIVGGVHTKHFVCIYVMTKVDLHDRLDVVRSYVNNSDIAYEVKISVLSI